VWLYRRPSTSRYKHHYRQDKADNEQNPRNVRGRSGNSAKAENPGDQRYDQESYSPTNHLFSPVGELECMAKKRDALQPYICKACANRSPTMAEALLACREMAAVEGRRGF
jgi:hypothetical protein